MSADQLVVPAVRIGLWGQRRPHLELPGYRGEGGRVMSAGLRDVAATRIALGFGS